MRIQPAKSIYRGVVCAATLIVLALPRVSNAHDGPPFPILVEEPVANYLVSVWADPDLGTGTFYVITDASDGKPAATEPDVKVWVQPATERLPKAAYSTERDTVRNHMQFVAHPEFDALEMWKVGVVVTPPGKPSTELTAEVEVTPPGFGLWDFAIYLFPFVLIGGLWGAGLIRRWKANRNREGQPDDVSPEPNAAEPA